MDNFTGLSLSQASNDIAEYHKAAFANRHRIWEAYEYLFTELSEFWASPKAVEFDNTFRPQIAELLDYYDKNIAIICSNSRQSYNILARANGAPILEDDGTYYIGEDGRYPISFPVDDFPSLLDTKNGVAGMNTQQVKNVQKIFTSKISNAVSDMDNIPMEIAFYDPDGSLQLSFANRVESIKQKIWAVLEVVTRSINNAMLNETHTLLLAKQQATESLSA